MRIVITSPPKMGNKWLKCLMGSIYDLEWLLGDDTPFTQPSELERWIAAGNFSDNAIFHQHCRFTPIMCDVIDVVPATIVTIVRDPYDTFVSMFYWLQSRSEHDKSRGKVRPRARPKDLLIGKAIDDPAVLEYLTGGFGEYIRRANEWVHSGRAVVARYEELHRDPIAELTKITGQIAPTTAEAIDKAIEQCSAENMRKMSKKMATHIRSAKVGDSRDKLGPPHLDIFRSEYGNLIKSLGYEVR